MIIAPVLLTLSIKRLQAPTLPMRCAVVKASRRAKKAGLIRAVHGRGVEPSILIKDLRRDQTRTVRGRREPVTIWCASRR
jgi:hypothetical protein